MNKNTENTVGALISEGGSSESSPISLALSASPVGFERVEYTPPAAPGADWSSIYAGTCIDLPNQAGVVQQPVLMGDVLTLPRAAQLSVYLRADDVGELLISSAALSEAEVLQRLAETPVCRPGKPLPSDDIHLRYDLDEAKWQEADTGAASWRCLLDFLPLAAGTYHIYGVVTNVDFPGGNNTNNRKLFRYALMAKDEKSVVHYYGAPRRVCASCGCGSSDDGDADFLPRAQAPGWVHDPCPSFVTFNPATAKALYDSPWRWRAAIEAQQVVITPPVGDALYFSLPAEDAASAATVGASAMVRSHIQYLDADFLATTSRTPAYLLMKDEAGLCLYFTMQAEDAAKIGTVCRILPPGSVAVEATARAQVVVPVFDAAGNLLSCSSPEGTLVCESEVVEAENAALLHLKWFAAGADVTTTTPFKQETWRRVGNTITLTRQQSGHDPHVLVRTEQDGVVSITKGEGAEAVVRRYQTSYPLNGLMLRTESVYYVATPDIPASVSHEVYNYSEAGWQLFSRSEGYGSDAPRSTSYTYNAQNRLSRVLLPDGGYKEYEYDSLGRVTMEKSPRANGLAKVTRTTYADARFYDVRPASVAEYYVNATGTEVLFRNTAYAYEESAELERITTTVTAGGSSQLQVSIEEIFGTSPAYAYAAGKPRFSQGIDGVQTWHEYGATTEHGAIHKHTSITKANGELVAAQSRKSERFIAADDTTTFEQESIWNGTQWLLLNTTAYEYDEQQRVTKTTRGNGRVSTREWMCCGVLNETDEDGITTTYAYDSARQLIETTRAAVYNGNACITPESITEYTRDAAGRIVSTTRRIGAMATTESTEYDALGRVVQQSDVLGRITTIVYSEDGLTTTVTSPSGATSITTRNMDGSTASVGGTAQRALVYVYDLNGSNERVTTKLADGTTIAQSISNGFGQTTVQAQASATGFIYTRSEFNAKGQMTKQYQDTGWNTAKTAPTLYEYDAFGNQVKQTLALAASPTKDNSPVVEMAHSVESAVDGVFSVTTQTRYNAEGAALVNSQKHLISHLSASPASKSISIDARGNSSMNWSEYTAPAKVTSFSTIPTSEVTAESVSIDGFTISQSDHAGSITTASRSYTATGMTLVQVDGRNNATTTVSDLAGRTVSVTDAANAVTTTVYDAAHDLPAVVTDAMGNTSCYKYDHRGRKIAEWGTALQPACFGYDEMDNMTSLRTFRAEAEVITTDPSERTDGDVTTWGFEAKTGLEVSKSYADNSSVTKTYDAYNRLSTETDARGNVKTHTYEHARGLHLGTSYTVVDGTAETATRSFTYNHLGQMTQLVDDSGTRTFGYNSYGERETDSLVVDGDTHLITETRDCFGRSTGYTYAKNGVVQQTVTTGYGDDGRIASAGFSHGGEQKLFGYTYLAGSNLLQVLTKPNGMTLTRTYETTRDLLTGMAYHRGSTLVAQRTYTYDVLGRPTARGTARQGSVVNDTFRHNSRSELTEASVNGKEFEFDYDNIGNRMFTLEDFNATIYDANALNQYTSISLNGAPAFVPQFDADGNQTLIKTSTGIWSVVYNAENRPVSFTNADSSTVVECAYDSMGRRAFKKVTVNGSVTLHHRYLYRGYLQIACVDLTRSHHPCLWLLTWDPSEPVATRPLAIQISGTWYTYGWDLTKNICELFGTTGYISTTYTYTPFGQVSASGSVTQPIQWSSEVWDEETGFVYYNWRYYNTLDGRWNGRDSLNTTNSYDFLNWKIDCIDYLGNEIYNPQKTEIGQHHSKKQEFPEIPERTGEIARSYTYIFGDKFKREISKYLGSLKADRIKVVNTIYDLLDDVKKSLKQQECISKLLVLGHSNDGHVILDDNYHDVFSNVEHISRSGDVLSHAMCKSGKIVFASCYAGRAEEMLKEFSKHVGVKVMANPEVVTLLNDSIMKSRLTGKWRQVFEVPLNNLFYSIYTGIFYAYKAEWRVFHPDGSQTLYKPAESEDAPIIRKNNMTYIGLSTLFGF